jgi:hypothetical protein
VEHKIGEAKECHGLRRARHRGLKKVDHQVKITAAIMNLKLLAKLANLPRRAGTALAAVAFARFSRLRRRVSRMLMNVVSQILEPAPE